MDENLPKFPQEKAIGVLLSDKRKILTIEKVAAPTVKQVCVTQMQEVNVCV